MSACAAAATASSVCNRLQCVDNQDGEIIVPTYDWASFLGHSYKTIESLLSFHSFAASAETPGVMVVRKFADSATKRLSLGRGACPTGESTVVPPKGLSVERQAYLYKEIREFCREGTQDDVCPRPPQSSPTTEPVPSTSTEPTAGPSSPKRARSSAHNRRGHDGR